MAKHRQHQTAPRHDRSRRRTLASRGGALVALVTVGALGVADLLANSGASAAGRAAAVRQASAAESSVAHRKLVAGTSATTTGRQQATPRGTKTATAGRHVNGSAVTLVGDSVSVAATPALRQVLPGISIDAMVGRQFSTGLQVLAGIKAAGQLRPVVVFALGTNGSATPAEIAQLYSLIGPRRLVLVNTYEARPWEAQVNAALAAAVSSHPRTTALADWYSAIVNRTSLLWPDGIHPQPAGATLFASLVNGAVQRAGNLPG